jgi:phage shock protein PspC (stress-responsive transcriptional regulator)
MIMNAEAPAPSDPTTGRPDDTGTPSASRAAGAADAADGITVDNARRANAGPAGSLPHLSKDEPAPEPPPLYPPGGTGGPGPHPLQSPPYYAVVPPQGGSQRLNSFNWIRSQGIYRGHERWIGGVASGIAQRLGVDPLIVRGVLIVLTLFAGIGMLLYGLAWALLPEPDGRIHVQEAAAGQWTSGMTGALITTIIGFPGLDTGVWGWAQYGFGGFVWMAFWLGGAIYLVYYLSQRNKGGSGIPSMVSRHQTAGPGSAAALAGTSTAGAAAAPGDGFRQGDSPVYGQSAVSGADPAWGPPPAVPAPPPGAGYYPVPGGPRGQSAKPRNLGPSTAGVAVTVGVALLVGGGIKALDAAKVIDLGGSGTAMVWASGAAVLGLGILFAGLRGRTSGILGFFAVVALLLGAIFNVVPNVDRFRFQNADWTPASIEQARNGFDITGGSGTADLTKLALNPPLGTDVIVPIDATASNLTVVIPGTVPVQVQADLTLGNLQEGSQNHGGITDQQSDYNTGKAGARLVLKISGTVSNVTIKEGN